MVRSSHITSTLAIEPDASAPHLTSEGWTRVRCGPIPAAARVLVMAFLVCLGGAHGWAGESKPQQAQQDKQQQNQPQQKKTDPKQMKGLDEQIQEIKSDVLGISAELSLLEEKLLYPSGTQVAIFVQLAKEDQARLDAVRLQIDGKLVAHYIYSFKELEALRKGGVQRIYVGNVATGDHQLEVLVEGKLKNGEDFSRKEQFAFRKEAKPKLVGLTLAGPDSGSTPIALGEW